MVTRRPLPPTPPRRRSAHANGAPRSAGRLLRGAVAFSLVAIAFAVRPVAAQQDANLVRRLERQMQELDQMTRLRVPLEQPIAERLVLEYGGSIRFGLFAIDNAEGDTRVLRQTDGMLYVRADLDGAHRFFGRLRFLYDDYNSGDSFDGRGDRFHNPIGDRWWYQFDLRGAKLAETGERIDNNVNTKVGRQYVHWGSGLAFSNVLYAANVDLELGDLSLQGLAGITPSSSTVDFDGSRPGFDVDTDRAYYGGRLEYRGLATHRPYVSVLVQRDENDRDFTVFESPLFSYPTEFDYDSEYWAIGSEGTLGPNVAYHVELVHQTGEGLSSSIDTVTGTPVDQTTEDVVAWAGVAGITWLFQDAADSRLDLEFIGGTGDKDRVLSSDTFGGNASGSTDRAFNGLGFIDTGLALAPEVTNLLALKVGYSTSPRRSTSSSEWLRLGVDGYLFAKASRDAPINVRTDAETFVGGEIDLLLDWRITSDVTFSLRYGIFLPGDAMPDGEDDPRHFAYAGVTYAF